MIAFDESRWEHVRQRHDGWWDRRSKTPLAGAAVCKEDAIPQMPLTQANCHDFSLSAGELAGAIEKYLASFDYLGDAYPVYYMGAFGPGVVAAMLGARLDNHTGRVWFHPPEPREAAELHFAFDPNNLWFTRIRDVYAACARRFGGRGMLAMVDLGGIMDILSVFRPGALLMYDLYDHPDEVKRLIHEIEDVWYRVYHELTTAAECARYGYTNWSTVLSTKPAYIAQCDFCYMIGPDAFNEFVLGTLARDCERLDRVIYHLDGPGQLTHLDALLAMRDLDAVQWVPGAGNGNSDQFPDLWRKIAGAGKLLNSNCEDLTIFSALCEQVGEPGILSLQQFPAERSEKKAIEDGLRALQG